MPSMSAAEYVEALRRGDFHSTATKASVAAQPDIEPSAEPDPAPAAPAPARKATNGRKTRGRKATRARKV